MNETGELESTEELSERIDALEARVMFQDDTIETLNQTVMVQWREIEALKRQIALLGERLEEAEANTDGPTNEPPPHY
ncbi:SlyX family protein [Bradyrhizobium sp. HKCCYLS1011]|uniref:SlyX family protein n=1 Tax=Bradyrhizobium sp. HKCCYLS1011 TaxID=3420733 RepID=UPI003EB730A0